MSLFLHRTPWSNELDYYWKPSSVAVILLPADPRLLQANIMWLLAKYPVSTVILIVLYSSLQPVKNGSRGRRSSLVMIRIRSLGEAACVSSWLAVQPAEVPQITTPPPPSVWLILTSEEIAACVALSLLLQHIPPRWENDGWIWNVLWGFTFVFRDTLQNNTAQTFRQGTV